MHKELSTRQYISAGEEKLDMDAQLWRRKQRLRNGIAFLWDKAAQLKSKFSEG